MENLKCDHKVFNASSGRNLNEEDRIMKLFSDDNNVFICDEGKWEGIVNEAWKEFVDEKGSDCTFEDGIFVVGDTIGFENEEEKGDEGIKDDVVNGSKDESNGPLNNDTMLKDIEEWRVSKSEVSLGSRSFDVEIALDKGGSTRGKISGIITLKKEVKDGDLKENGEGNAFEESENVGDHYFEEHTYMLPMFDGNNLGQRILNEKLQIKDDLMFEATGVEKVIFEGF